MRANSNIIGDELVYRVVNRDGLVVIDGLVNDENDETLLLYRYPDGDVDSPYDHDTMLGALYDEWQVNEQLDRELKESGAKRIVFVTPYGRFKTYQFHVVDYDFVEPADNPKQHKYKVGDQAMRKGSGLTSKTRHLLIAEVDVAGQDNRGRKRPAVRAYQPYHASFTDRPSIYLLEEIRPAKASEIRSGKKFSIKSYKPRERLEDRLERERKESDAKLARLEQEREERQRLLDEAMERGDWDEVERLNKKFYGKYLDENPGEPPPPQFGAAKKVFEGFHDYEMRASGRFKREVTIPARISVVGPCKYVTYRSDKWNDGTHEYIHKITSFPRVQMGVVDGDGPERTVPKRVRDAVTVSFLGTALGFAAELPDGDELEGTFPKGTEWFWSPTGKALYAIAGKSRLLAVVWGGDLDVEPRGIVG